MHNMCIYICVYIYTHVYTYMYVYIYIYIYMNIHTHTHTYAYTHIHTHVYIYIYIHACVYTYIRTHIHTYTHRYIDTLLTVFGCSTNQIPHHGQRRYTQSPDTTSSNSPFKVWIRTRPWAGRPVFTRRRSGTSASDLRPCNILEPKWSQVL